MSTITQVWFTADTHFGHGNIIKHCNRPFASADEMDDAMINNINAVVQPDDILYHLGDFAVIKHGNERERIQGYRDRINCKTIYLIAGNHDPHTSLDQPKPWLHEIFSNVYVRLRLKTTVDGERQFIVMDHYAGRVWNSSGHGVWQLYGHSHGTLPDDPRMRAIDIGVDCHNFRPLSLDEIAIIMANKTWTSPYDRKAE